MRNEESERQSRERVTPIASRVTDRGLVIELVYRANEKRTMLAIGQGGEWRVQDRVMLPGGEILVPYSASNNLIRNECVLFPSAPERYGDTSTLVADVGLYLKRYLTLSEPFERIAPWYVLFSWVHDAFNELPYLRFRGDYGTGKTRALLAVGSICYKPFFASGASTPSPIFHTLDSFGGTLVLDEADFRFSDERADIVKILNNGNVRGMPVLRTIVSKDREFNPKAFHVFGPKIVAMRKEYDDRALESRFFTEETAHVSAGAGVPINLPNEQREEALALRNKLLAYRFIWLEKAKIVNGIDWPGDPRLRQAAIPLLSIVEGEAEKRAVRDAIIQAYVAPVFSNSEQLEIDVVSTLMACFESSAKTGVSCGELVRRFNAAHPNDPFTPVSPKWMGVFLRQRLRLVTQKSNGVYVVPRTELRKVEALVERHKRKAAA